ncbi:MAG: hypothetical protein KAU17_04200 [Spirochaetales bacterium]|nr:hypothetical protein [Spirochaetales bacterium]
MKNKLLPLILLLISTGILPADDDFSFSSDKTEAVLAKGREYTTLTGNAIMISGSMEIHADKIELFGSDFRYARCTGNVRVTDDEKGILLFCDNLLFDREEEISRIEGYAEMVDQKNEIVVKGHFFEDRGKEEITLIQIGVRILKEDMVCRGEFARYLRKEKILELSGMPSVYWKGDEYSASRIIINLDTDEILLQGDVSGRIQSDESDTEEEQEIGEENESDEPEAVETTVEEKPDGE